MAKICVSACLLGENCRYDGKNMKNMNVIEYLKDKEYVAVCPECLGGLSTPREPSEIVNDQVLSCSGKNVTKQFVDGAMKALEIAKNNGCEVAIFTEKSPSCGSNLVYDGSFTGRKIEGQGITSKLFQENGIEIISSTRFK